MESEPRSQLASLLLSAIIVLVIWMPAATFAAEQTVNESLEGIATGSVDALFKGGADASAKSLWQQAAMAAGFITILVALGLVIVRNRIGSWFRQATISERKIRVVESQRVGAVQLTLVEVDDAKLLVVAGANGSSIASIRLDQTT